MNNEATKKPKRRRLFIISALVVSFTCICLAGVVLFGQGDESEPLANAPETQTGSAEESIDETNVEPTNTLAPVNTPVPTNTPRPTNTPVPTNTSTTVPDPITLTGTGDDVVDLDKWDGPAVLHIIGPDVMDNFIIENYDANNNQIELLVNTIGAHEGYTLIDILEGEVTRRFQVKAGGPWTIEVYPLDPQYMHSMNVPGHYTGNGDDVVILRGEGDVASLQSSDESANFIVYGYSDRRELLVNEIGPYSGEVLLPNDTFMLTVIATGQWNVEITD